MANRVVLKFNEEDNGILKNDKFEAKLNFKGEGFAPYELFLGGFASCLHATFIGIMKKKRLSYKDVSYDVVGYKRDEVPTILNKLVVNIVITGADKTKEKQINKSFELAHKYCSISETIRRLEPETIINIKLI